jgi:hypothetical protein
MKETGLLIPAKEVIRQGRPIGGGSWNEVKSHCKTDEQLCAITESRDGRIAEVVRTETEFDEASMHGAALYAISNEIAALRVRH